jgi:hypothetical protein
MSEHGILFSAPMVRAILAGRKTQTRRVVSPRNCLVNGDSVCMSTDPEILEAWPNLDFGDVFVDPGPSPAGNSGPYLRVAGRDGSRHRVYPRVQPGDRLWVRETWCQVLDSGDYLYRADLSDEQRVDEVRMRRIAPALAGHWRPSIFMPRRASRITLTVTAVRPERLQDISGEDAIAEGIAIERCSCEVCSHTARMCTADASAAALEFAALWQRINGKRPGCAWADNPWVWVIAFTSEVRS